jgi:hypothetical protein
MVDAGPQSPSIAGHIVRLPGAGPHRTLRLMTDVDLLLAHTIASVRLNQRMIVFEPPEWLAACEQCQEAYAEARRTIEKAGGLPAWIEKVTSPVGG